MWHEAERLAVLRSYRILDVPETAAFEDFVRIAAGVCETPIAVVNLIDEGRQWFAAELGLGVRQTTLDVSICAQAILQPGVFVVPDLTQDPRFACNPLVVGPPRLRFYGGALLETAAGLPLGTLCVLDHAPRPQGLSERQAYTLEALARQVMTQLELRRALRQQAEAGLRSEALLRDTKNLLAEKHLLIQEAHHRVSNSLATVQALLLLQARSTRHQEVARELQESAARIRTFGVMHQHLYRVAAVAEVDVAEYLQSLIGEQQMAIASALDNRTIRLDASSAWWPSAEAPILGLIMVELVTNALKYGAGPIDVTFRQAHDEAVLTVEDAGQTLPADFEPSRSQGLGMRVVTGLLQAHGRGRLEVDRTRGHTCFIVKLAVPAAPNRDGGRTEGAAITCQDQSPN